MAEMLDRTLKEEGHADHLLSSIAERVNPKANKSRLNSAPVRTRSRL
ncbi:MAG: hypothetical protein WAL73_17085 [Terracidiphilus sp.]